LTNLLRNLVRRKLRSSLTIVGITIGIWALVVMSSMANKIGALVEGGSNYYQDKIVVTDATNVAVGFGFTPMRIDTVDEIRAIPGVAVAFAEVGMLLDPDNIGAGFGIPDLISGALANADEGRESFEVSAARGRLLTPKDEGESVLVLGADLARKFDKGPGDEMTIRENVFLVIGVLEPTLTAPDTTVLLPLEAAQDLLADDLPGIIQQGFDPQDLATQIVVFPDPETDIAALAELIEADVSQVQTLTGADFDEQIGSATALFNAIILGVALISLSVGGLSVINTMAMSVAERTREIGIKRAIGASRFTIVREFVAESGVIGLIGGLLGLVLGAIVVMFANQAGRQSGTILFDLTAGTAIFALVFASVLGMLAGLIPAWSAARLDPVQALRHE
jgi:putative ABC transport system permease protein